MGLSKECFAFLKNELRLKKNNLGLPITGRHTKYLRRLRSSYNYKIKGKMSVL